MPPRKHAIDDDDPLSINSAEGPAILYSPIIRIPEDDPLLTRLHTFHGADVRREHDDLTTRLAAIAERSHVMVR